MAAQSTSTDRPEVHSPRGVSQSALTGAAQSLLRIVVGFLFMCFGAQKLLGWFGGMPHMPGGHLPPTLQAAGAIELVGGILILLGLFTRPAAFIASGEMAFAYFMGHFPHGVLPRQNNGEPAVLFCFIFLFLAAAGAGPFSLDRLLFGRRVKT